MAEQIKKKISVLTELKKIHPERDEVEYLQFLTDKRQKFEKNSSKMFINQAFKDIGGNVDRFNLFFHLGKENHSVNDLVEIIGKSQPTISRNVKILEKSKLLKAQKDGKFTYYRPRKPVMEEINHFFQNWIPKAKKDLMD